MVGPQNTYSAKCMVSNGGPASLSRPGHTVVESITYWPLMNAHTEQWVAHCAPCQDLQPSSNCKEPMIAHEIPDWPWFKLSSDIFYLNSQSYVIVVDYYSKYPEVLLLPSPYPCTASYGQTLLATAPVLTLKLPADVEGLPTPL